VPQFLITDNKTGKKYKVGGPEGFTAEDAQSLLREKLYPPKAGKEPNMFDRALEYGLKTAAHASGSAINLGKDVWAMIGDPQKTASNMRRLKKGILQKYGLEKGDQYVKYADQAGKYLDDRYGSAENIKNSIMTDPVGVLADLSVVLSAGETMPGRVGTAMAKASELTSPTKVTGGMIRGVHAATSIPQMVLGVGHRLGMPVPPSVAKGASALRHMSAFAALPLARAAEALPTRTTRALAEVGKTMPKQTEMGGPESGQIVQKREPDHDEAAQNVLYYLRKRLLEPAPISTSPAPLQGGQSATGSGAR